MKEKYMKPGWIYLIVVALIAFSCKKAKEYEYVEDYEGNYNFTIIETLENIHPNDPYVVSDTFTYYGTVIQLRRDNIEITYSNILPSVTYCFDKEYFYMHILDAQVDKNGKLSLPCNEAGDVEYFSGMFVGLDTVQVVIRARLGEFSSLEHEILGVR